MEEARIRTQMREPEIETMDLLRFEDRARADRERARVLLDPSSRRDLTGYINFTPLRLYGAGSDSGVLEPLARYLRDYVKILAQVRPKTYDYFLSPDLLKDPVHFFLEGFGVAPYDSRRRTYFSPEEYARLREYLDRGGFLFIEGGYRFLQDMIGHLQKILGKEGSLVPIPPSHPLYHSYYDFDGGFPGEDKREVAQMPGSSWYYPGSDRLDPVLANPVNPQYPSQQSGSLPLLGLWGVELKGELVALISDLGLSGDWNNSFTQQKDDVSLPSLMAGTNIVVYALSRPDGLTPKQWKQGRPQEPPLAGQGEETLDDGDLLDQLDACLALVQSPPGTPIQKGGFEVVLDGRYSVALLKHGWHGLLLYNLPAGRHWLEVRYQGKREQVEVELEGGQVKTVVFGQNRLAFFTQLYLKPQAELVKLETWLEKFAGLKIEEVYLGEDRQVLE